MVFRPHASCINVVQFHPSKPSNLFTTSYDGTIRCMDLEKQHFEQVFATDDGVGDDSWLQHSTLVGDAQSMLLGNSVGDVSRVDLKTNKLVWKAEAHESKVCLMCRDPVGSCYGVLLLCTRLGGHVVRRWLPPPVTFPDRHLHLGVRAGANGEREPHGASLPRHSEP